MDGGPFRVPQPSDRRPVARPEPVQRQAEEPYPAPAEPKTTSRPPVSPRQTRTKETGSRKKWLLIVAAIVGILVLVVAGWFAWSKWGPSSAVGIDSSKYQAVFFTNGQVYFGRLQPTDGGYMKLTEVYYLQSKQNNATGEDANNPQAATNSQNNNVQLIKLGQEIHGPEDLMVISRDQILFYENLKTDGKVAKSIEDYKNSAK